MLEKGTLEDAFKAIHNILFKPFFEELKAKKAPMAPPKATPGVKPDEEPQADIGSADDFMS